ncbi:MAG TPA: hypothetical protein VF424_14550, partial [Vicinamibacterales bacterium]
GIAGTWLPMAVVIALGSACDSPPAPTPTPPPTPSGTPPPAPTPPPLGTVARYHLAGRVTDQAGSPVSGAGVEVAYFRAGGDSSPPSTCPSFLPGLFCWLATRTNEEGGYAVEFEPGPWPGSSLSGRGFGRIHSWHDGYEFNIQWVPTDSATAVQDFRLRPVRRISAGASIVLSVEPDSSLCSDLEDWWVLDHRCEVVQIEATAGTLVIEARAAETGGVVPYVFWATTGNYAGFPTRPGPGTVSIPVRGGTYRIFVGIPEGTASQRFDVLTSLR